MTTTGRTFKVTSAGKAGPNRLTQLTDTINAAEAKLARTHIEVGNLHTSTSVNVGRNGGCFIPVAAGASHLFRGCCYEDIYIDDSASQVTLYIDGSWTEEEKERLGEGKRQPIPLKLMVPPEHEWFWSKLKVAQE